MNLDRYHRQMLLPQIGPDAQQRLAGSRALLVGCGALGTTIADQLVRAGLGHLTLVDRDIVELTNLQRQTLFDERDAREGRPKAVAAAERLRAVNSSVRIDAVVADVHAGNIEDLAGDGCDLLLDGTDNVATRYLINDLAVKRAIPWIYGAAVGVEGRVMAVVPGGPCLRCVFPAPPGPGELQTCDTAGVLGMGPSMVGALQGIEAIRILTGQARPPALLMVDAWNWRIRAIDLADARRTDCPCCGRKEFGFLDAPAGDSAVTLCGRNAVQVRPSARVEIDLNQLAEKLRQAGRIDQTAYLLRCWLVDPAEISLTVFADGRALVHGTSDLLRAKSLYARFVG